VLMKLIACRLICSNFSF